ncbi:hypothetical protein IFR05_011817 [Cadophora sp. M221]|nr:hypothetical protein IFR05_011817 [Cadophora sp. M221]
MDQQAKPALHQEVYVDRTRVSPDDPKTRKRTTGLTPMARWMEDESDGTWNIVSSFSVDEDWKEVDGGQAACTTKAENGSAQGAGK